MNYSFEPIGYVRGGGVYPQEAPHQSTFAQNDGFIELKGGKNFEQALDDLTGFDRIWVIFVFENVNDVKDLRPINL